MDLPKELTVRVEERQLGIIACAEGRQCSCVFSIDRRCDAPAVFNNHCLYHIRLEELEIELVRRKDAVWAMEKLVKQKKELDESSHACEH